ncbi:hypothetical protein EVAR_492_1 [Eumeta japonica]|uniref:Uncharacterized protein n=1 Tax=Eumeta variegata TaxID=151549 RepID=A0A4C1SAG9_EUMVA|nr:hypothetical protein EVAR_492_1 [Eumeta japonica]
MHVQPKKDKQRARNAGPVTRTISSGGDGAALNHREPTQSGTAIKTESRSGFETEGETGIATESKTKIEIESEPKLKPNTSELRERERERDKEKL